MNQDTRKIQQEAVKALINPLGPRTTTYGTDLEDFAGRPFRGPRKEEEGSVLDLGPAAEHIELLLKLRDALNSSTPKSPTRETGLRLDDVSFAMSRFLEVNPKTQKYEIKSRVDKIDWVKFCMM